MDRGVVRGRQAVDRYCSGARCCRHGLYGVMLPLACLGLTPARSQVAPSAGPPPPSAGQLTPRTLTPASPVEGPSITIESAPPQTPKGADKLIVHPGSIALEDALPEQSAQVVDLLAPPNGKAMSISDIYAVAAAIERRFASDGYPLMRVVVPPQHIVDGGQVRLVLVDGFIEDIDLANVPRRLVRPLRRILAPLIGRRGLTMASLARRLTLADDIPGATIRSTLAAGKTSGGTRLIIQAKLKLMSGSITFDNRQSPAFRGRNTTAQISLSSPFGFGEQIYGYVSADPCNGIADTLGRDSPRRTYGGGIVLPLDGNGTMLNVEYTSSITQPLGGFFATRDTFERTSVRISHPLLRTRRANITIGPALDLEREKNFLPDFGFALSHDRYSVMRLNSDANLQTRNGFLSASMTVSYGLPGSRGNEDFPSRAGAGGHFVKIEARASASHGLPAGFVVAIDGYGQKLLVGGVPSAELFSIDGSDGISGVLTGTLASDQGFVGRGELRRAITFGAFTVQPYGYAAIGHLYALIPTPFDTGAVHAYGTGATVNLSDRRTSITPFVTVEYGHTHVAGPYRFGNRVSVTAGVRF